MASTYWASALGWPRVRAEEDVLTEDPGQRLAKDLGAVEEDLARLAEDGRHLAEDAVEEGRRRLDLGAEEAVVADFLMVGGCLEQTALALDTGTQLMAIGARRALRSAQDTLDAVERASRAESLGELAAVGPARAAAAVRNLNEAADDVWATLRRAGAEARSNWKTRFRPFVEMVRTDWS